MVWTTYNIFFDPIHVTINKKLTKGDIEIKNILRTMPIPWLHNDTKIPSRPYLSDKKTLNYYNFFNF